jgi:hypothetical protein
VVIVAVVLVVMVGGDGWRVLGSVGRISSLELSEVFTTGSDEVYSTCEEGGEEVKRRGNCRDRR